MSAGNYDPIALGILWDRLVSIADEIVNSLVRTSFSTNVRESYDLSCVVFDARGRSLAQGSYSVPSFTGTAPDTLRHMLARFPAATLSAGDVIITNDPWLGTGHLFDVCVMQPVFRDGEIVAYCMSITHLPDIGGGGFSATARTVYEEGLCIPICKLYEAGRPNDFLLELIRTNVRVAQETLGDLMANVSCSTVGGRMVNEFMTEYRIDSLEQLASQILELSEKALRDEIRKIPDGIYAHAVDVEGVGQNLRLACTVQVRGDSVHVDFEGTSPAVDVAINVPACYTKAMVCYSIKVLTTPRIPNNDGSLLPITFSAPEGSVLNPRTPYATGGRHVIGHFITPLVFGALAKAMPDCVQADSGMLNLINVQGTTREGKGVSSIFFCSGGYGALKGKDGAPATPSPSNMTGTPIEVWENLTGLVIEEKVLLPDSGGAGEFRGGLGQRIRMRNDSGHPMVVSCIAGRTEFPAQGILGGHAATARVVMINDEVVHPKGRYVLQPGDRMTLLEAGGGGVGNPRLRARERVAADVALGYVTQEAAARDYGYLPG